jgi:hypothetical protein
MLEVPMSGKRVDRELVGPEKLRSRKRGETFRLRQALGPACNESSTEFLIGHDEASRPPTYLCELAASADNLISSLACVSNSLALPA